MAANTKIEWCQHSWSPWRGCAKVSPGCANCYADATAKRNPGTLGVWGVNGKRVVNADWKQPLRWNKAAAKAGERWRIFPSMCDPFEDFAGVMSCAKTGEDLAINQAGHVWPPGWPSLSDGDDWGIRDFTMADARERFLQLIRDTPHLDWLVLTKRPENVIRMTRSWGAAQRWPANLWLGTSVEDQERADERIPHLLRVPAAVRFLSCEPLLGPVDLKTEWLPCPECRGRGWYLERFADNHGTPCKKCVANARRLGISIPTGTYPKPGPRINWVIVGGESGPKARPCRIEWIQDIVRQCREADVPVFVKQVGAKPQKKIHDENCTAMDTGRLVTYTPKDPKGGDWQEWPPSIRIREFPAAVPSP